MVKSDGLTERQVERLLISGLKALGYLPVKTDAGARARWAKEATGRPVRGDMPAGFPDIVVLHPSKPAFLVEVKRKGGRLSTAQVRLHDYLRSMGYNVYVVVGREGVDGFLRTLPEWERVKGVL